MNKCLRTIHSSHELQLDFRIKKKVDARSCNRRDLTCEEWSKAKQREKKMQGSQEMQKIWQQEHSQENK